jgi:hypothetical protein
MTLVDGGTRCQHLERQDFEGHHHYTPPLPFLWTGFTGGLRQNLSLTVIPLTVYKAIFEYQNQVIFNMTVFDVGPRWHIDTCF